MIKLQYMMKQSIGRYEFRTKRLEIMIMGLRVVRTFLLCSTLLTEDNNDTLYSQKQKQDNGRMREDVGSLLIRVEDVVRKILDDHIPYQSYDFRYDMESCEDEMDSWYTVFSAYLQKDSTAPLANQVKAILDSVFENLIDCLIFERSYGLDLKEQLQQIEALQVNITVMRHMICFGSLLCTENQEFQCLLTYIEPFAVSAAHLTLSIFSVKGPMPEDVTSSMVSALILKINHAVNPLLHEKYTLALASLKHSRELYDSTPDLNDHPFIVRMEHCIVSVASTLWKMLQLGTSVSLTELELYDRLGLLRILLKKQPDIFDDGKIRDLIAAIVYDAGVQIYLLHQKDLANNQCFQDNRKMIWAAFLEGNVAETSRLNICKTNALGFIDFLLQDYLMEVNSSEVDSNTLGCVQKIREHLVLLQSIMGKLAELRNQHVWNLGVAVAYKIEFLIDQLVLGDVLDSFSMSLQSITED